MPDSIHETDHLTETFEVTTIHETKTFDIATDYEIDLKSDPSFITVWGDDDFENGPIVLRSFNLNHVVDWGWTS